jgi:antitoxin component YwqK of YwqJK toxin-antitoxin module
MRFIIILFLLFSSELFAQSKLLEKFTPTSANNKKYDRSIIDSTYGITMYEKLNVVLGGDSTRNCNGYGCNGWVEDYYTTGQLLHKGYYQQGQLKTYKNFYPNGQLERSFKAIDDYRSSLKVYYENGQPKSDVVYDDQNVIMWTDYYSNGQIEFVENYNRSGEVYISKKSFYENGKPETLLELVSSKKMLYSSKEYHSNGNVREEGSVVYNPDMLDYQKIGTWKIYKEDGNPKGEQTYINGRLDNEKMY